MSVGQDLPLHAVPETRARAYRLRGPFAVKLERLTDGTIFASHANLPVHGYGETPAEALAAFGSMFDSQWRLLVDAPIEELTRHAKTLRQQLQACVEEA